MTTTRIRRTDEQLIADIKGEIASLEARAARKQVKRDPALKHVTATMRSIDKAMSAAEDVALRKSLDEARSIVSACLSFSGVLMPTKAVERKAPTDRSAGHAEGMQQILFAYVAKNPGARGEHIAAALGTDTTTMRPAMKRLIESGKVTTEGQRRGMSYSLAGVGRS